MVGDSVLVVDAISDFHYRQRTMQPTNKPRDVSGREAGLLRILRRLDRLDAKGRRLSERFTGWRLAIFAIGLLASIALLAGDG